MKDQPQPAPWGAVGVSIKVGDAHANVTLPFDQATYQMAGDTRALLDMFIFRTACAMSQHLDQQAQSPIITPDKVV